MNSRIVTSAVLGFVVSFAAAVSAQNVSGWSRVSLGYRVPDSMGVYRGDLGEGKQYLYKELGFVVICVKRPRETFHRITLAPHADPGRYVVEFYGTFDAETPVTPEDETGHRPLLMYFNDEKVVVSAPRLYQIVEGKKVSVSGTFMRVQGTNMIRLDAQGYNRGLPLIAEYKVLPTLSFEEQVPAPPEK